MERIIRKNILRKSAMVLACILALYTASAAAVSKERELFDKGYDYCISHNPEKAIETFNLFLKEYPESSVRDAAMYWTAKAYLQMKSLNEAKGIFTEIIKQYPESPYLPHIEEDLKSFGAHGAQIALPKKDGVSDSSANMRDYLLARLAAANSALSQANIEIKKIQSQREEEKKNHETRILELTSRSDNLGKTVAELQTRLSEAEQKAAATGTVSSPETERGKLQAQLDQERKRHDAKIAELTNQSDSLSRTVDLLQSRLSESNQKASAAPALMAELERRKLQAQLEQERVNYDARIAELANQSDIMRKTVVELQARLSEANQKASAAEIALLSDGDRRRLQAQMEQERRNCEARISDLKNRSDNMSKTTAELQARLAEANRKAEKAATSESALFAEIDREKLQLQLEEERKNHDAKIDELRKQSEAMSRTISELQARLAEAEKAAAAGAKAER